MALQPTFRQSLPSLANPRERLDYAFLYRLLSVLEDRLRPLEDQQDAAVAFLEEARQYALLRIDEALLPAFEAILDIQEKGFLIARSSTSHSVEVGNLLTFTIDNENERSLFAPSPFLALTREATPNDYAIARLINYQVSSGELVCEVLAFQGDPGPHSDWVIGALAGSTIAQYELLDQALELRDYLDALKTNVQNNKTIVTDKTNEVSLKTSQVETRHGQISTFVNDFSKRYLGLYEANPTEDVAGNPVQRGALAFIINEAESVSEMRVYLGDGMWKAAGSSVNGMLVYREFTATAGQTEFSMGGDNFDPGFAYVYQNGVLLDKAEASTSSGTSFVLASPAEAGERYSFIAFGAFSVANTVTPAAMEIALNDLESSINSALIALQGAVNGLVADAKEGSATIVTTDITAVAGGVYFVKTTAGVLSVTLPATPVDGNVVEVWRSGANAVTINRNGKTIAGLAENLTIDEDNRIALLTYMDGGWRVSGRAFA